MDMSFFEARLSFEEVRLSGKRQDRRAFDLRLSFLEVRLSFSEARLSAKRLDRRAFDLRLSCSEARLSGKRADRRAFELRRSCFEERRSGKRARRSGKRPDSRAFDPGSLSRGCACPGSCQPCPPPTPHAPAARERAPELFHPAHFVSVSLRLFVPSPQHRLLNAQQRIGETSCYYGQARIATITPAGTCTATVRGGLGMLSCAGAG
jgi:hypothetical protein